jgi:hypothetical protein
MAGGETSVSGTDDNGVTLSYTVGLEQVFINGALQARGSDYVATTGTTVTGLSALGANDIVSVVCYAPFNVTNTYTKSETDGVAAAAAGLRMVVPTSVAVGSGSGSVDATGNVTFSGTSSISLNGCFTSTYDNYRIIINLDTTSSGTTSTLRFRSGTDNSSSNYAYSYQFITTANTTYTQGNANTTTNFRIGYSDGGTDMIIIDVFNPMRAFRTGIQSVFNGKDSTNFAAERSNGQMTVTTAYDGFTYFQNSMAGTIRVYGYKD